LDAVRAAFSEGPLEPWLEVKMPPDWTGSGPGQSDDEIYRAFARALGGSSQAITAHRQRFVAYAAAAAAQTEKPFVDVGCGAGEFLKLLKDEGIEAIGVETSEQQTALLRAAGFDVRCTDAVSFLEERPDASLGGVSTFNVIEHMPPDYLLQFMRLMATRVRAGGCVIMQTSSPLNAFEAGVFTLDLTHERMYHPLTVCFYLAQMGFADVAVLYHDPAPVALRLSGADEAAMRSYAVVGTRID